MEWPSPSRWWIQPSWKIFWLADLAPKCTASCKFLKLSSRGTTLNQTRLSFLSLVYSATSRAASSPRLDKMITYIRNLQSLPTSATSTSNSAKKHLTTISSRLFSFSTMRHCTSPSQSSVSSSASSAKRTPILDWSAARSKWWAKRSRKVWKAWHPIWVLWPPMVNSKTDTLETGPIPNQLNHQNYSTTNI